MDFEKGMVLSWMGQVFLRRGLQKEWEEKAKLPDLPRLSRAVADSEVFIWSDQCRQEVVALGVAAGYTFEEYVAEQFGVAGEGGDIAGANGVREGVCGVAGRDVAAWTGPGGNAAARTVGGAKEREAWRAQAMELLDPMPPSVADILRQLAAEGGGVYEEREEMSTKSSSEEVDETEGGSVEVALKISEDEVQGGQNAKVEGGTQVVSNVANCSREYTSEELEYMMESSSQRD